MASGLGSVVRWEEYSSFDSVLRGELWGEFRIGKSAQQKRSLPLVLSAELREVLSAFHTDHSL